MGKLTIKVSAPMARQEVILSNDVIFCGNDGVYILKAGKQELPIPVWEKLTVEYSNG